MTGRRPAACTSLEEGGNGASEDERGPVAESGEQQIGMGQEQARVIRDLENQVKEQARNTRNLEKQVKGQRQTLAAMDERIKETVHEYLLPLYEGMQDLQEAWELKLVDGS
ncbi:hypothetical protein SLS58_009945 [Diplodia intermedia]|uniref:Uncharacterized protein n=1 Tax=Diplodia intermedia TaxID=856260 RepID=A0ABR3T9L6_9PEZI